jgi:hypothetical protein
LARRHGVNPKTLAKWKKRMAMAELPTGPKEPKSRALSVDDEAAVGACRRPMLLPRDGCLDALQPTIRHLTRSSLRRYSHRHGVGRLPDLKDNKRN